MPVSDKAFEGNGFDVEGGDVGQATASALRLQPVSPAELPGAGLRVLFLGQNWYGSCARACTYALRRLGCDVWDIDSHSIFPRWRNRSMRLIARLISKGLSNEYNGLIIDLAHHFKPDFVLAFKGNFVLPETLAELRKSGIRVYNYFPDRMSMVTQPSFRQSIAEYDCLFDTKSYWDPGTEQHVRVRERVFVPHGYDPQVHRRLPLTPRDLAQYGCDVTVIATHTGLKESLLDELLAMRPGTDLAIWGNGWREGCNSCRLQRFIKAAPLEGDSYAKAVAAARINLALMGVTAQAKDETSTRTYEIPACGGFMLHERSAELLELFVEDKEVACFGSVEELAEKLDYFLAHPLEREAIARAGYARCVPAYSYDNRMAEILRWHRKQALPGRCQSVRGAAS